VSGQDVGDGRQLLRRGLRLGDEGGDHLGGCRQHQDPAHDRAQRVQPQLEPGRDAEVAAAAADRPEQVGMGVGVHPQLLAVGGHHLGGQQVVDGEAVLADQEADPTAQGDPADPHRAGVAEPGRQAMLAGGGGVVAGCQSGLGPGGACRDVDVQGPHVAEVEHDAAVADAVAGVAVAAAADGQLQPRLAGQRDHPRDVGGVGDPDDDRRAAVEAAVEDRAGLVVAGVVGGDHPTVEGSAQLRDRESDCMEELLQD